MGERGDRTGRLPVVVIPGADGLAHPGWRALVSRLRRDGYEVHHHPMPTLPWSPAADCARELAGTVARVLRREGTPQVHLVGHSLGGIVARAYVKRFGGARKVRTCITLGSPHHGTWAALPVAWLPGMSDILPGSPFLRRLNAGPEHRGVRMVSIYSLTDPAILPPTSCHLEGAVNHRLLLCGHNGLLSHPAAYRWLIETLRKGDRRTSR